MEMKSSDLSARLLATENLSVIRARTRTASFDIKSRVLTLPLWKEMTPEVEDMLIGHEVGHALYTTEEYTAPIMENRKLMGYMNIIEDVRIEKLIKRKYPGLRKRMNEGYKQLNDRDFFGVNSVQDFSDLLLIDRINLYFKVGFNCGVKFTPEEKAFVNRAERCETIQEVIDLAKEIYAYSKEQAEQRKQERIANGYSDIEDEEDEDPIYGDFDVDGDDFDQDEEDDELDSSKSGSRKQNDEQPSDEDEKLEAKTDRAFQQRLEDLADDSTEYHYWKFDTDFYENPIVGYKKILNETKTPEQWDGDDMTDYRTRYMSETERKEFFEKQYAEFDKFKTESLRTVNYLVKEFEMKKSAQMYKRAQVSKVGSLDMKKVYAYKLQDDLFKRVTTLPQGKNHGMIMLVDWSGSMDGVLQDTIKQVVNLAMFCQRVQVPYRVFAFTTDYQEDLSYEEQLKRHEAFKAWQINKIESGENILSNARGFHLLELFSSKMSQSEFNAMAKRTMDYRFRWNKGYSTSGTPLNEALSWCYLNLGSFIKNHNIEKTTFITLTDGEGGALHSATRSSVSIDDYRSEVVNGQYKKIKMRHFIKDEVTQKTYEIRRDSTKQTEAILRMIKDRYNVTTVGFYICRNHRRDLHSVIRANIPDYNGGEESLIDAWRKAFRDDNFASIKNTGRDELFLIPQTATKIEEGELSVNSTAKAQSIARNFSKYLNTKKTSRILLNRFVSLVA
jgi:hypothetical protein